MARAYAYVLDYNPPSLSAIMSGGSTMDEAQQKLLKDIAYYREECGYPIANMKFVLEEYCTECDGYGKVVTKRTRYKTHKKLCPECKGKNSRIRIF